MPDYRDWIIYFRRRPAPSADAGHCDGSGRWITQSGQDFEVADVTAGGPAKAPGLEPGDVIVAVDGAPASTIRLWTLRERQRNAPAGSLVTLLVRRHDPVRRRRIAPRDRIPPP